MNSWHTYPKIYNVGHAYLKELFLGHVTIEEKIDGSQFSFGRFGDEIKMRSKGQELCMDDKGQIYTPGGGMFQKAADTVFKLRGKLNDGWTYRGEFLQKPKHNVLAYDSVPAGNIILFDINPGEEHYLNYGDKMAEADRLGLQVVPCLYAGTGTDGVVDMHKLLTLTSVLGGQKIEGFVIKNYSKFGPDKKALMGKHVSESFKEKHKVDWKEGNPGQNDIIELLIGGYRTAARWDKAIIHLRERGELENAPKDIGKLVKEVSKDILDECGVEIRDKLFEWAWNRLHRGLVRGLPEYYKTKLLESQPLGLQEQSALSEAASSQSGDDD